MNDNPSEPPAAPADASLEQPFDQLGLAAPVQAVLADVGYETPSPVQARTIPPMLEGRDVVGLAQTGTGKTAAFALPILSRIDPEVTSPQALVLAPTRELALQVSEAFERYASRLTGVHVLPIYGGQAYGVQLSALRRGVHVVVGTPGRVLDHLDKGTLDLSGLRFMVLDEADEMLKMGFAEDVEAILSRTPAGKQTALFSATIPDRIRRLSQQYLREPVEVTVEDTSTTNALLTQQYLLVRQQQKVEALTRLLEVEDFQAMLLFVRTKQATETFAERLRARGFSAAAINGDVPQSARERTVSQLRDGRLDILVATDVAARGLDVERISHVVNVDIPTDTGSYVHRVGRTGRAGRSGTALSFVTPRERHLLRAIEKATRSRLEQRQLPSVEDVNSTRLARFDDQITRALADTDRIDFFRDVVAHYVAEYDVPEVDVAAALAAAAQGEEPLLLDPAVAAAEPTADDAGTGGGPKKRQQGRGKDQRPRERYTIQVGKRHRVEPRQIVGAIANEGGLDRADFGSIEIMRDFSVVELPADLPDEVHERLRDTRVAGRPIRLTRDQGPPGNRGQKKHGQGGPR